MNAILGSIDIFDDEKLKALFKEAEKSRVHSDQLFMKLIQENMKSKIQELAKQYAQKAATAMVNKLFSQMAHNILQMIGEEPAERVVTPSAKVKTRRRGKEDRTPEENERIHQHYSDAAKRRWKEAGAKNTEHLTKDGKKAWNAEEKRAKHVGTQRNVFKTDEFRSKMSAILKEKWRDDEYRTNQTTIARSPERRKKLSDRLKASWAVRNQCRVHIKDVPKSELKNYETISESWDIAQAFTLRECRCINEANQTVAHMLRRISVERGYKTVRGSTRTMYDKRAIRALCRGYVNHKLDEATYGSLNYYFE